MKKILIFILFLLLAWTGSTWFIGNETTSLLKTYQKNALANKGLQSSIEITDYKKSFLKSTAKTVVSLKTGDPELDDLLKNVRFNSTITHGPILWGESGLHFGTALIHSTLDMDALEQDSKEILKEIFANKNPLSSRIILGIDQNADYDLIIPSLAVQDGDSKLSIKNGLHLFGTINLNTFIGTIKGTLGKLDIDDDGLIVKTDASSIEIDMQGMVAGQMLGSSHFNTPSIALQNEIIPPLNFAIDFSTQTEKVAEKGLNGSIKLIASDIKSPLEISKIKLNTTFKEFQIKGLEQLVTIQNDQQQLQLATFDNQISDEELERMTDRIQNLPNLMIAAVQNVLKQDKTNFNIKMDVESKQGNAWFLFDTRYIGNGTDLNLDELTNKGITILLKILDSKLDLNIPKTMLATTPAAFLMPSLIEQGVIVEKKDNYRLNMLFKNDKITLNDKTLANEEFMQLLTTLGLIPVIEEQALPEGIEAPKEDDLPTDLPPALLEELSQQLEDSGETPLEQTEESTEETTQQQ